MDVDTEDPMIFCVALLKADNYYAWSHGMTVVLWYKALRKFASGVRAASTSASGSDASPEPGVDDLESEAQQQDMSLPNILAAVDGSYKALMRQQVRQRVA